MRVSVAGHGVSTIRLLLILVAVTACDRTGAPAGGGGSAGETCNEIEQRSGPPLLAAIDEAAADLSCQTDDDCVLTSNDTDCHLACGILLNRQGAATLAAAITKINADICSAFVSMKCQRIAPPCVPFPSGDGVACVSGLCTGFFPAAWKSLAIERHAASTSPPRCEAGSDCTSWTVSPGGTVARSAAGQKSSLTLSPADLAAVDGILRSMAFREKQLTGFTCSPPVARRITVDIERAGGTTTMDATSCVDGSDPDVSRLYQTVTAY
jgi:hypothetical protein